MRARFFLRYLAFRQILSIFHIHSTIYRQIFMVQKSPNFNANIYSFTLKLQKISNRCNCAHSKHREREQNNLIISHSTHTPHREKTRFTNKHQPKGSQFMQTIYGYITSTSLKIFFSLPNIKLYVYCFSALDSTRLSERERERDSTRIGKGEVGESVGTFFSFSYFPFLLVLFSLSFVFTGVIILGAENRRAREGGKARRRESHKSWFMQLSPAQFYCS